jgi:hypothetical protein
MYIILFADDIVLFTTNPVSLQSQIDNIFHYSEKWGLKINVNKTKICVFEKRRSNDVNIDFYINGEKIEQVDNFTYLGINFMYTGNMTHAVKALHDQALRAYHNLMLLFDKVKFDVKTKLLLFDTMVVPILLYGSEIWGVYNYKEVDKLHIRFCKHVLGVKQQTPNYAVLGELGRLPLSVTCKERSLNFWLKIMKNVSSPIYVMYRDLIDHNINSCWASRIHSIIDHLGFAHIRFNFDDSCKYLPMFKNRLRDQFLQDWSASIRSMPKLEYYCNFKKEFKFENYLNVIENDALRNCLARFRLSSHNLEIETGRYSGIVRENRLCKMCNQNVIENEYHLMFCCSRYRNLRIKYHCNVSWPNKNIFNSYMSTKNKKKICNIAKYIKDAFTLRNNTLENITVS